jgi:transmembrane sensor
MESPVRAKFNKQIYEEACEWFIECRSGDLDDAARAEFDRWLRKSPEHQSAYLEIAAMWNEGPTLDLANKWDLDTLIADAIEEPDNIIALERTPRPSSDTRTAPTCEGVNLSPAYEVKRRSSRKSERRSWRYLGIAVSILLVIAAAPTYLLAPRGMYATSVGEQRSLALSDGSTVQLNSLSRIRVRYTAHERTVDLIEGQALFHVAKDLTRPFVVCSGQTRVRAIGTQFDVYRKADDTVVTVVEGRVAILGNPEPGYLPFPFLPRAEREHAASRQGGHTTSTGEGGMSWQQLKENTPGQGSTPAAHSAPDINNPDLSRRTLSGAAAPGDAAQDDTGPIFLTAGEQIIITPRDLRRTPHPNVIGATAWTQRQLVFDSASLTEVAQEFNRYNERKLVIDPAALGSLHISGVFSSTDAAPLIRFLRDRPGLRVIETPAEIRVEKDL